MGQQTKAWPAPTPSCSSEFRKTSSILSKITTLAEKPQTRGTVADRAAQGGAVKKQPLITGLNVQSCYQNIHSTITKHKGCQLARLLTVRVRCSLPGTAHPALGPDVRAAVLRGSSWPRAPRAAHPKLYQHISTFAHCAHPRRSRCVYFTTTHVKKKSVQAWYLCKHLCLADGVIQVLSCTSKCIPLQDMLTCVGTFEVWKYNCTSNLTLYLKTSKYWPTAQLKSICATVHAGRTLQWAANICTEDNHSLKAAYRRLSPGNFVAVSHYCTALDFYFWEKRKKKKVASPYQFAQLLRCQALSDKALLPLMQWSA